MSTSRGRWPSIGFLALCLTYLLLASFFLWGLSTPALDRVWTIWHGLKTGQLQALTADDREVFQQAIQRYPLLARELLDGREIDLISSHLDGWIATPEVTILRTPGSGRYRTLKLDVQTPGDLLPLSLVLQGQGWEEKIEVTRQGPLELRLPAPGRASEIIEVMLEGPDLTADPSVLGIRFFFPGA